MFFFFASLWLLIECIMMRKANWKWQIQSIVFPWLLYTPSSSLNRFMLWWISPCIEFDKFHLVYSQHISVYIFFFWVEALVFIYWHEIGKTEQSIFKFSQILLIKSIFRVSHASNVGFHNPFGCTIDLHFACPFLRKCHKILVEKENLMKVW